MRFGSNGWDATESATTQHNPLFDYTYINPKGFPSQKKIITKKETNSLLFYFFFRFSIFSPRQIRAS
jgi:hypothetical protein